MYLCKYSLKFVLEVPGAKTLTGVLLFCGGATILHQFQTLLGALLLGRALLIGTLRYVKPEINTYKSLMHM